MSHNTRIVNYRTGIPPVQDFKGARELAKPSTFHKYYMTKLFPKTVPKGYILIAAKTMRISNTVFHTVYVKEAITKARKGTGVIRYMAKYITRDVFDQMYKRYVRPHIDYGRCNLS